jgi:uncharacterized protein with NRDE domain
MCLAVLALGHTPGMAALVAANRDEFHARPSAPAARWPAEPAVYGGRDLQGGGTWMAASGAGRYALVTNYRDFTRQMMSGAPSRGALVENFLRGAESPAAYMARVRAEGERYNGFNLIVGDTATAWYYGNRGGAPRELAPGVYAISNHLLDTPWPKLLRVKTAFERLLAAHPSPDVEALYAALHDREPAADSELPATGMSLDRERLLSSPFIVDPAYGTRASTVLRLHANGSGELFERRYDAQGQATGDTQLHWPHGG